ncbi:MAG: GDP-mannose 4,6-dehydratase [bacterium]
MRVLITGITGFVGSHMAEYILREHRDWTLFGTFRWRSRMDNIEEIKRRFQLIECDLSDFMSVRKMMDSVQPDYIFHLAAQSFVPASWDAPVDTMTNNMMGQVNLFDAVRQAGLKPKIQIACSSEEYGMVHPEETPIAETNPLRLLSPYAVSKVIQDTLGYQYAMNYNMHIIRTRAFNHSGPRRGDVFVESNFARQVALIEKGRQEPVVKVGNLEAQRDFTDVRDVVRGYFIGADKGEPGEVYNICSGKTYSIKNVLERLLSMSSLKISVEQDPQRMRPSDVPLLLGDFSKFKSRTGWEPSIPFEKTLEDLLNYWRDRV